MGWNVEDMDFSDEGMKKVQREQFARDFARIKEASYKAQDFVGPMPDLSEASKNEFMGRGKNDFERRQGIQAKYQTISANPYFVPEDPWAPKGTTGSAADPHYRGAATRAEFQEVLRAWQAGEPNPLRKTTAEILAESNPRHGMTAVNPNLAYPMKMPVKKTIWGNIKNIGSKIAKSPLGKLGGRIFGGLPMMLALEMDWKNKENLFLPKYKYDPDDKQVKRIWE